LAKAAAIKRVAGMVREKGAVMVRDKAAEIGGTKVFNNTSADLVTFVDIASNGQNAFIVFQQQVPPTTFNGPDGGTDIMGMIVK